MSGKFIKLRESFTIKSDIILPGVNKQFEHLLQQDNFSGENALIIGPGCESMAVQLLPHFNDVSIILNDYNSLMQSRTELKGEEKIKCKMMDYANTDFKKEHFDLVYAQSSISVPERKNILKEIKRILNKDGILCDGEIVSLKEPVPAFVKDVWERSGLEPLPSSGITKYFESKGFGIISESDLSFTLKDFYQTIRDKFLQSSKEEKEENKKFYTAVKHESNLYLRLGGEKFIGYKSIIMRKKGE